MKPLNQYPKHKRKKIEYIRLKNSIRFDCGLNPSLFAVTITTAKETINQLDCIMAAVRQLKELKYKVHNFPVYPNDNTVQHIRFIDINKRK